MQISDYFFKEMGEKMNRALTELEEVRDNLKTTDLQKQKVQKAIELIEDCEYGLAHS